MGPRMTPPRPGMGPLGPSSYGPGPGPGMRPGPPGMPPMSMAGPGRPQWPPSSSAVSIEIYIIPHFYCLKFSEIVVHKFTN